MIDFSRLLRAWSPIALTAPADPTRDSHAQVIAQAHDLHRVYKTGEVVVNALRGVSLSVSEREFTVLAGPSGSGKTTLLNLFGALDSPTRGSLSVKGHALETLNRTQAAKFRLRNIGFVFQAYNLVPVLTAYENAEFTLLLQGMAKNKRKEIVVPLLERVGLGSQMHRRPHELSGGQQQRVAVVRALAPNPTLVLADEPTANLDSKTSAALLDLMAELNEEHGSTFLFSTHDPVVIERARRVVRLLDGEIESDSHSSSDQNEQNIKEEEPS